MYLKVWGCVSKGPALGYEGSSLGRPALEEAFGAVWGAQLTWSEGRTRAYCTWSSSGFPRRLSIFWTTRRLCRFMVQRSSVVSSGVLGFSRTRPWRLSVELGSC